MGSQELIIFSEAQGAAEDSKEKDYGGYSFYQKLFFLYFLNIVDWICTQVLLSSGKFHEINPLMQPVVTSFWGVFIIKGIVPLILILVCAAIFKFSESEQSFATNLLLYIGISVYTAVNLLHIFNFVLLFFVF